MITWRERKATGRYLSKGGKQISIDDGQISCDSTDEKPVEGVANGTVLIENDTGKIYLFSESLAQWFELGGGE